MASIDHTMSAPVLSAKLYASVTMQALAEHWLDIWSESKETMYLHCRETDICMVVRMTGAGTLVYMAFLDDLTFELLWRVCANTHDDQCAVLRHCLSVHINTHVWPKNDQLSAMMALARSARTVRVAQLYQRARLPRVLARRRMALLRLVQFLRERM
jgi:hypothetical protein